MSVYLLTSLRPKPRTRFLVPAVFRSSLGGSVEHDMIIPFSPTTRHRQSVPTSVRRLRERTSRTEGPLSTPASIEAFRYSPIHGSQSAAQGRVQHEEDPKNWRALANPKEELLQPVERHDVQPSVSSKSMIRAGWSIKFASGEHCFYFWRRR